MSETDTFMLDKDSVVPVDSTIYSLTQYVANFQSCKIVPSVLQKLTEYFELIFAKSRLNSRRAYVSDLKQYFVFCLEQNPILDPLSPDFELQKKMIQRYVEHLCTSDRKNSVIHRHLMSISKLLRIVEIRNPLKESEYLRKFIKLVLHSCDDQGTAIKPIEQKQALSLDNTLVEHVNANLKVRRLKDKRDLALLNFCADTLLRGSEIEQINVTDLNRANGTVFVKETIVNRFGQGELRFVSPHTMSLIDDWLCSAKVIEGPVFRRVDPCYGKAQRKAIGYNSVYKIIKSMLERCGIDPTGFTANSLRVGGAVGMLRSGVRYDEIMDTGGWRTHQYLRYVKQTGIAKKGAAKP